MSQADTMKRRSCITLVLFALWFATGVVNVAAQTPAADIQKIENLLKGSQYSYSRVNDPKMTAWVTERRGESIGAFRIFMGTVGGVFSANVTVVLKNNFRKTTELFAEINQMNRHFDYVKVGIDEDGDVFVRFDSNLRILDIEEMNHVIAQAGNAAAAAYVALKPYMLK